MRLCRMPSLPGFLLKIRQRDAVAARALEFAILTAARTGEVLGALGTKLILKTKYGRFLRAA